MRAIDIVGFSALVGCLVFASACHMGDDRRPFGAVRGHWQSGHPSTEANSAQRGGNLRRRTADRFRRRLITTQGTLTMDLGLAPTLTALPTITAFADRKLTRPPRSTPPSPSSRLAWRYNF